MKVIYTAIFGPYEELKEPTVVTPGWDYICYTDQPFESKVWRVIHTPLYLNNPQFLARRHKILWHILPEIKKYEFNMWIDASFTIACDLNEWWDRHFKAPFTCAKHPIRSCVYVEADICISHGRGNAIDIREQVLFYRSQGLPARNGVISSGILMRQNTLEPFYDAWFSNTNKFSLRDQLSFAYTSWVWDVKPNLIDWDYRERKDFIFLTHFNRRKTPRSF